MYKISLPLVNPTLEGNYFFIDTLGVRGFSMFGGTYSLFGKGNNPSDTEFKTELRFRI